VLNAWKACEERYCCRNQETGQDSHVEPRICVASVVVVSTSPLR
jgi:hypothetical protein